ncbi:MAG: hypothetical protein QXO70_01835 [Candidatus Pacearchaeota archaeon]
MSSLNYLLNENKRELKNFSAKYKIFILQKNSFSHTNSGIINYLLMKQNLLLSKLLKNNPELYITQNIKQEFDYTLENEYYQTEHEHHLAMILKSTSSKEHRKYFFTIRLKEQDKLSYAIFSNNQKVFISKTSLQPFLESYEEPNEGEVLSFLKKALYGEVSFYSNIPNVSLTCNHKHLGTLPFTLSMQNGTYECKFQSPEGITKVQKFFLNAGQNLKIYQSFYDLKKNDSILLDTFPEIQKVKIDKREFQKLPIAINLTKEQKLEFQNKNQTLELTLKLNPSLENSHFNWIVLPYMLWDALHPKFISFWESPKTFGASLEINRYLSVINQTKQELKEWSFLESKPFFPENIEIEGSFFPAEDTGTGIFQIHFGTLRDYYTLEVEEEKVSLFHFPSSNLSIGTYIYPIEEKRTPRKFTFLTHLETKTIQIYLNNKQVLSKNFSFDASWKIILSFRGNIFNRLNALNSLKIAYTKLLTPEEYKIWKEAGNF